jgi:hypothetical protein
LRPVFFTVNLSKAGIEIYRNGALVKKTSIFHFSDVDLTGQLILGNKPSAAHSWAGRINGLAIYGRELSAKEVSQHFAYWTGGNRQELIKTNGVVATYLFTEGQGNVVHNQVNPATDLVIPKRFFVLREQFLEFPWNAYRSGWAYWRDVAINIVGFTPLGFSFGRYFCSIGKIKRIAAVTIALGFSVSFVIEGLQTFLPTRNSDMTDVIANTLGTAVGVFFFLHILPRRSCST